MFSVLLSIYYKESSHFLIQSLSSLFSQIVLPTEVILVEDGPLPKELKDIIEDYKLKYSIIKTISLPQNVGLGKALNEGLKHCSNELIARMDTDDIAKPDRFEKQLKIFQEYPEYDLVGAWIDEFEGDPTNIKSTKKVPQMPDEIYRYAKYRSPVNHPVVMFRKSAVLAAGGYQHFPLFEDYYLWVRMLMNGAKFYNIQESLLYFRTSPDMFKRRGGLKYALTEVKLQYRFFKIGFISFTQMLCNVIIRFCVRILPNSIRSILYKKQLR